MVVNAYTGRTDFYVSDPDDPLIRTWERIYPGTFKSLSEMPAGLHAHIRYPEDFFLTQAEMYGTYHMKDPSTFYNREDLWTFPRENYSDETVPMQPYYVIMRLPGETRAEYVLMLPMVPQGRDNMIAWLAARCDGADYGHLFEFAFSKDRLFYGPYQIQALINQNPDISEQYSLWNQMGSKVILGNLLVIPLEDSLLYVEPLYIRAENGQLPELKRVLASYGDRTVMGTTIDSTLAALFKGGESPAPVIAKSVPPSGMNSEESGAPPLRAVGSVPAHAPAGLQTAAARLQPRAIAALKQEDWNCVRNGNAATGRRTGPAHRLRASLMARTAALAPDATSATVNDLSPSAASNGAARPIPRARSLNIFTLKCRRIKWRCAPVSDAASAMVNDLSSSAGSNTAVAPGIRPSTEQPPHNFGHWRI